MRQEFTKAVKLAAFNRAKGKCEHCTARLFVSNVEYHHDKECEFNGQATLENCVVLCRACHSAITRKRAAVIAKSSRIRNRNIGIKKPRTITRWRKFNGEVVIANRDR